MDLKVADSYWATFFGLSPQHLNSAGLHLVPHHELADYNGAWVFTHGQTTVVSVPPALVEPINRRLGSDASPSLTDHISWCEIFGTPVSKIIGPAYDGFCWTHQRLTSPHAVRTLGAEDLALLDSLKQSCTEEEWDHAGIDRKSAEPIFGCFIDGVLTGVSQNEVKASQAVSPGVLTSPQWRRRGIGAAVLSAAIGNALSKHRIVLYQSLMSNHASIKLGESLGVRAYAQHLAYRFSADGRSPR